jgi:transcriptional regulator with XRE-family HTH domain
VGAVTFPERLKFVINKSGLKREEFAERAGVSKRQLFNYLGGSSEPTLSFFQRSKAEFPWIDLEWLTTGSEINCMPQISPDPYITNVAEMMRYLDDDTKANIQFSVQKEKQLQELLKERQEKKAG